MSVRNRIAMFEQTAKEGASPEDRGRSPGVSSIASGSDSPRPLSKVRTSFVAIEKDGRIGLQRNPSETSSVSARKLSGNPEAASTILQETTRANVASPESLRPNLNRSGPSSSALSNSSLQDAGPTPAGQFAASPKPSPPTFSGPSATGLSGPGSRLGGTEKGLAESPQITQAPKNTQSQGPSSGRSNESGKESQGQGVCHKDQSKIGNGSQGSVNQGSDNSGSRTGANRSTGGTKTLNGADKAKPSTPSLENGKTSTPSSQPKPAAKTIETSSKRSKTPPVDKKPAVEKKSTPSSVSPGGFVKPRPKSPTRPVKLPPGLTSHTAASGSKTKNGSPEQLIVTKPRSTSRSSMPASGKNIMRSSSVANRQRPSIGPPPKQVAKDHPVPKKEAKVDEGFLARMMRPTQASASKVAEKAPTTPPRKTTTLNRKPSSAKIGAIRKAATKTTSTTASSAASPDPSKVATPAAKEIVHKAEKTTSADKAIKIAKEPQGAAMSETQQENAPSSEIPNTPEREPVIVEEEEEPESSSTEITDKTKDASKPFPEMEDAVKALGKNEETTSASTVKLPKASEAPKEAFQEPDVEMADAPLVNGNHKTADTEIGVSTEAEKSAANGVATEAPKFRELDDEETW